MEASGQLHTPIILPKEPLFFLWIGSWVGSRPALKDTI